MTTARHSNNGLRKICNCSRRQWAKCPHDWHFNFKPRGGRAWRFSLDVELGRRLKSKEEAKAEAENIRTAIRAGTFVRAAERRHTAAAATPDSITLAALRDIYVERRGTPLRGNDAGCLRQFLAFGGLATKEIGALTEDDIEAFFADLRAKGRAVSTRNKYVQAIKGLFRWAVKKGYLQRNPVDADTIKRGKHAKRHRRLMPDVLNDEGKVEREGEERRLLTVAGAHLQRLVIAALESCCRLGELLSLTWADINLTRKELTVRAETAKTNTTRILPISTRLAGILEMARTALETQLTAAHGRDLSADDLQRAVARAYVFGDAIGGEVKSIKRAWATAVLKAHGYTPQWTKGNKLSAESRAALHVIDLHFHDLRHEGGSRLLEAGWPLHHIQHMLGHENLSQTSTYLNATKMGLRESMQRFDDSAPRCNPVAIETAIEPPLHCNAQSTERSKEHLH